MHDLVIRGGTVIDGTGVAATTADVAIDNGMIAAVGKAGPGRREIDADGLIVTPGFVDHHTHYDGQATWDPHLSPSSGHGVTTAVMGNCGVGFAPCREADRGWLIRTMEGVEDIPGTALSEGITWKWETFEEYLDTLDSLPFTVDVATQVPHSALRGYVMGPQRAEQDVDATEAEVEQMQALVREAIRAGALGFSTSRTPIHKTADGVLVAGTNAARRELEAIAKVIAETDHAMFEIAADNARIDQEVQWLDRIARDQGCRVMFNLTQVDQNPTGWTRVVPVLEAAARDGVPLVAQVAGRSVGVCMCWRGTAHPFALHPSWLAMADKPWPEQLAALRDPAFKARLLSEKPQFVGEFEAFVTQSFHKMFPMGSDFDYEPKPEDSLKARAEDPRALAYDLLMENEGSGMIYFALFNYSDGALDNLHTLHTHPCTRMGLADGGAHCGAVCDAGMPTFMLTHWARDRTRGPTIPLVEIIRRQTSETARTYRLNDRGVLAPGYRGDVNVIDFANLKLQAPKMVWDLPAGGRRLIQDATGYRATVIKGEVVYENGEHTGAFPGALIRGPRTSPG